MNRFTVRAVLLFILVLALLVVASIRGQQAPCYVWTANNVCAGRFWAPMTTTINSYPAVIERYASTGGFVLDVCWAGMNVNSYPCSGVAPQPISLQAWCDKLKALPVPDKFRPSDPTDLYSAFVKGGVCP